MTNFNPNLALSTEDIKRYLQEHCPRTSLGFPVLSFDSETTSLDTRKARIVGWSMCGDEDSAMYIPVGHLIGDNVPLRPSFQILSDWVSETKALVLYYNATYDRNITQANVGWVAENWEDVLNVVYNQDPDRKAKGLKLVALEDLEFSMAHFESLFSVEERNAKMYDISTKLPSRCTSYACADAWATRALYFLPKFQQAVKQFEFPLKVDRFVADQVRKAEHNGGLELRIDYIGEQIEKLGQLEKALKERVFREVGRPFDINVPKQLGVALFEWLGLPPTDKNEKSGQYKTGQDEIEKLADLYPVVDAILAYRKVGKAKRDYFEKLKYVYDRNIPVRFNFNLHSAPTFRFSAPGGDPDKDGATGVNIQAVSNGEVRSVSGVDLTKTASDTSKYDLNPDELFDDGTYSSVPDLPKGPILGWQGQPHVIQRENGDPVCIRGSCDGCPANCSALGIDTTLRKIHGVQIAPSVRQSFQAPEGWVIVSMDYERQEIVVGANLSGDSPWLDALSRGEDLHASSAKEGFGLSQEQYDALPEKEKSEKRGFGKVGNFLTFYGGTDETLAKKTGMSASDATTFQANFEMKHPVLYAWMAAMRVFARKNGYIDLFFGRRRWLKQFYESKDKRDHAFADRSAVNTMVQGTSAEITRMAIARVAKRLEAAGLTKLVRFVMQLHDELTYIVRDDALEQALAVIADGMRIHVKTWRVQLDVEAKVGRIWGKQKKRKIPWPGPEIAK